MRHFIDSFLEPALLFAADWSLRWAALLAVAALFLWTFRPRRASIRQLVLLMALIAGLLLPVAPRWGGGWQWQDRHEQSVFSTPASPPPLSFPRSAWERTPGRSASRPTSEPDAMRSVVPQRSRAERENESVPPIEPVGRRRLIVLCIVSCWFVACVYHLIRRLCGSIFLWRLRRESVEVAGATGDLFAACWVELRVGSTVRLATHSHVRSPILIGCWRPQILVPPDWPQRRVDSQRAALLHELAHVRRRDHLLAPLLEIVRIAFFFHPLVRWLLARLEYEREMLCDEMVVCLGFDRRVYARLLLEFARSSGRFAWPAVSLSMSRQRTVKGRIYHLLEDDMKRWIQPLPARWAVVLGASLLILSLGLGSYRIRAEEKGKTEIPSKNVDQPPAVNKPAALSIEREDLRYDGKDFNEWRKSMLTELKGSVRVDGIRAFAAFGANGYGAEATEAILEIMRGYDTTQSNPSDDDAAVAKAGYQAVAKVGEAALPALTQAVEGKNRNMRRFAIEAIMRMGSDARPTVPVLLRAMKHEDVGTRQSALEAVRVLDNHAKGYASALIEALKDDDPQMRYLAVTTLREAGSIEAAKPAVPALLEILRDKRSDLRFEAIATLNVIGAEKRGVVRVSSLLLDTDRNIRIQAYAYLQSLGTNADEAVPSLIAVLKKEPERMTIDTLENIGPAAKDAIPELTKLLRSNDTDLRRSAMQALRKISPDDKR